MTFSLVDFMETCHNDNVFFQGQIPGVPIEGGTGPDKRLLMAALIYALDANLVYEMGVNQGGGSAAICRALACNPGAKYVGFDIKQALNPVVGALKKEFPHVSIEMEWGDTTLTLPARSQRTGERPDFIMVDALHTDRALINDTRNALACIRKGGIIFIDDAISLKRPICQILPEKDLVWFTDSPGRNGPGCCFYQAR